MAFADSQRASSSSTRRPTYNVYLSFHGEDIEKSFADHLCSAMKKKGINVLVDDEKLERLSSGIQEFKCAVVIISKNYAFSKRCLMKLTEIVERREETRLKVLPVFYDVIPSEVRRQENNFADAFKKHAEDPDIDEEERKKWRAALKKVSLITGWDVRGRRESEVIEDICGEIVGRFSQNSPNRMERRPGISEEMPRVVPGLERPQSISEEMPRVVPGLEGPQSISEEMRRMQSYVEMLRRPVDDARRLLYFTFTSLVFFF